MSNKYMSAIRHETLTNKGKINNLEPLWSHYSELLDNFMRDINYNLVKGNGVIKKTKAKAYQGDIKFLLDKAIRAHNKKVEKGEVTKDIKEKLKEIEENAIETPLSARYVQCCYDQAYETYSSWSALLSDKIKEFLGNSSIDNELIQGQPFLTTCYRINKNKLWYSSKPTLKWAYDEKNNLIVPTKENKAVVELEVPEEMMKFMRRLVKQARKTISLPDLSKVRTLKLDSRLASLEMSKKAHHVEFWLKLSTLDKGKPVYIPLKNNPYYKKLLETGEKVDFTQICLRDKKLTVSPILAHDKSPLRTNEKELGLDFGLVTMFTTSNGERHGIKTFTKFKIWDELLLARTKELQKQGKKLSSDPYYKALQNRIRSFFKNEIGRILNKLEKKGYAVFVVEKLDFRYTNLSKKMNRLLTRTYRKVIKDKFVRLEEKYGITTIEVNAAYTSQESSNCGFVSKNNRKTQIEFVCKCCNFKLNADVNAARNIVKRRSFDIEMRKYANEHKVRISRCLILKKLLQKHNCICNNPSASCHF